MPRGILLVDDTPSDVKLILRALQGQPVHVTVAADGVEAVEALSRDPLPCVVLLDVKLPRLDGFDVLRHIRADARTARLPVVMLTSSTEESDLRTAYALGANSYVRKPIDADALTTTIQQLVHYWLAINCLP